MIGMNDLFMEMQGIDQSINCDENSQIIGVLDSQKQAGKYSTNERNSRGQGLEEIVQ